MLSMWQDGSVLVGVSLQFEALRHKLKKIESLNMAGQEGNTPLKDSTVIGFLFRYFLNLDSTLYL